MPATQKFRARMKRDKYNPDEDSEFQDEFGHYFSTTSGDGECFYIYTLISQ